MKNVFASGELNEESAIRKFRAGQTEGNRKVAFPGQVDVSHITRKVDASADRT
jgi:hypothetical protein